MYAVLSLTHSTTTDLRPSLQKTSRSSTYATERNHFSFLRTKLTSGTLMGLSGPNTGQI